jgi:PAS domain S-box-containing protein
MSEPVNLTSHLDKIIELNLKVEMVGEVLTQALDEAPDCILLVNTAGVIVYANKFAPITLGYTVNQLKGMHVEELMPERFREQHVRNREGYVQRPYPRSMGRERNLNLLVLRPGNAQEEVPVDINLSTFRDKEGKQFVIVIIRRKDVTNG